MSTLRAADTNVHEQVNRCVCTLYIILAAAAAAAAAVYYIPTQFRQTWAATGYHIVRTARHGTALSAPTLSFSC